MTVLERLRLTRKTSSLERFFASAQNDSLGTASADSQDVFFEMYWPQGPLGGDEGVMNYSPIGVKLSEGMYEKGEATQCRGRFIGPLAEPINRRWARSIGPYGLSVP